MGLRACRCRGPAGPGPDERELGRALALLRAATRPLVLAGRGAVRAGAREELEELAGALGAVLGTTLLAKGLFDGDPWNLGIVGGFSSPGAARVLSEVDAVLAFGASLGPFTTREGELVRNRRVLRVDLEADGAAAEDEILRADAREAAAALNAVLRAEPPRTGLRTAATRAVLDDATEESSGAGDELLDPRRLMRELGPVIPRHARVVVGGGHFWTFPCMYLDAPPAGEVLFPLGFAAVGQALPFAVGVAAADPARPVIAIEGDGSLLMNVAELETAARYRLPVALVVMNDGALSAEVVRLRASGYSEQLATYPPVDFAAVGSAFGCRGLTVDGRNGSDEALAALAALGAGHGPVVIDARIRPGEPAAPDPS